MLLFSINDNWLSWIVIVIKVCLTGQHVHIKFFLKLLFTMHPIRMNCFCICTLLKIQYIQRHYGLHTLHQRRSDEMLFVMNTQFPIITLSRLF
jgi:hypothetical protein